MRRSKRHEFRLAYNTEAVVDARGSQLIVRARLSTCASDRNELVAAIAAIAAGLGRPETVLADNGYASGAQVTALEARRIETLVATAAEALEAAPPTTSHLAFPQAVNYRSLMRRYPSDSSLRRRASFKSRIDHRLRDFR